MIGSRALVRMVAAVVVAAVAPMAPARAETAVTLALSTSPSAGQAGVDALSVTGSGFPSGTIPPADVTVTLTPATSGAGPSAATAATAVTTLLGSSRRITLQVPAAVTVTAPTTYRVAVGGTTSTRAAFASGNTSRLTVDRFLTAF